MEQETCYVCKDCGREHEKQRVVDHRRMASFHTQPAHWKSKCNICGLVAVDQKNYTLTQKEYMAIKSSLKTHKNS